MTARGRADAVAARLRALCVARPGAVEEALRRGPTYRIAGKIFALERRAGDSLALWCKAPKGEQAARIESDPGRFFSPPYYGRHGWIGVRLEEPVDWGLVESLVERSFRLVKGD